MMLLAASRLSARVIHKCRPNVANLGGILALLSSTDHRCLSVNYNFGTAEFSTQALKSTWKSESSSENDDIPSSVLSSGSTSAKDSTLNLSVAEDFRKEHQIRIIQDSKRFSKEEEIKYFPITSFSPDAENSVRKIFNPILWKSMIAEGYTEPTPIQAQSWPVVLAKRDLISVARTGSGKTIGFLLPAFQKILSQAPDPKTIRRGRFAPKPPSVLVLAPTRELVVQIEEEAQKYCRASKGLVQATAVFGGNSKGPQIKALKEGVDIVIATPGRCYDLHSIGCLDLSKIDYFVLDEADRMLDMGFEPQIREIVDQLPPKGTGIQTSFFTATWPKEVETLARDFVHNPIQINVGDNDSLNANKNITQHIIVVSEYEKEKKLLELLDEISAVGANVMPKLLIFLSKKADCDELSELLCGRGLRADALHGDKPQAGRMRVMDRFKTGQVRVLVATDVAGRGLDVKDVEYVINFDFPIGSGGVEDYVHRIGRTARGGKKGVAYAFLNSTNLKDTSSMKELVGVLQRCDQEIPPELMAAVQQRDSRSTSAFAGKRFSRFSKPGDASRDYYARKSEDSSSVFGRPSSSSSGNRRPSGRGPQERNRRSFWEDNN